MEMSRQETGKHSHGYEMPVWSHNGATRSFSHILYMLPEQKFAVSICSSAHWSYADFGTSLDTAIMTLAVLPQPFEGPDFTIDYSKFDDYVGTYNDPYNVGEMIITRDGDQLLIEMPALEQAGYVVTPELEAAYSDVFFVYIDGQSQDLTFIRSEPDGLATYIRNRSYVATRVDDEPDAGITEARPTPSRENLERFMKRIRFEPNPDAIRLKK